MKPLVDLAPAGAPLPEPLPVAAHTGYLEDLDELPRFLASQRSPAAANAGRTSCGFCGVGDSGTVELRARNESGVHITDQTVRTVGPTPGCVKIRTSLGQQPGPFPIHLAPSERTADGRRPLSYTEGIARLADLLLAHRPPYGRTLLYACGQVDYFAIFAFQEALRLLGVRNLAGNAEHCLNAGAVHNEILTGQEGPFLTIEQALEGPNRIFLLSGWNGLITHPPAFGKLLKHSSLEAYLVEVAVTESAMALASKLGPERVLLVRSGSDPHLALAVAHEILHSYPHAVHTRFVDQFADRASFDAFVAQARDEHFAPPRVAERICAEPSYAERIRHGIEDLASMLAAPGTVPIHIPSVGLSQTKGAVAHAVWGSVLALVGKYGLAAPGEPAGGTLRLPGQINAQTEVQGLSRRLFMGRIPVTAEGAAEAARRMGLPPDAYATALGDEARAALDYSDPRPGERELFLCFGTQFESNMMERSRWVKKLTEAGTTLVVVDPIPDPFSLREAALLLPSPPHAAAAKLYQNGEWRLTLSVPRKRAAKETRTDATIVYDAAALISRRLREDPELRAAHPDLARHRDYLRERFEDPAHGGGLRREGGEVSREQLWERVQGYMTGDEETGGPLYCRPEHADGRPIAWHELLAEGAIIYGGVGTRRFLLDYDTPGAAPFRDIYRRPGRFRFFRATEADLRLPEGVVLNSGRSALSDDRSRQRFALGTFNSGKATTVVDMPSENPLCLSPPLAARLGLATGDRARVTNTETGASIVLPVVVTDRAKGETAYVSFHKTRAEIELGRYLNEITSHTGRCPYTAQSNFKSTRVTIVREEPLPEGGPR
jgi:anaerobic selenocysteine-containing dehydrogenase